eukprot:4798691-Prymnesium_polylepis.1
MPTSCGGGLSPSPKPPTYSHPIGLIASHANCDLVSDTRYQRVGSYHSRTPTPTGEGKYELRPVLRDHRHLSMAFLGA